MTAIFWLRKHAPKRLPVLLCLLLLVGACASHDAATPGDKVAPLPSAENTTQVDASALTTSAENISDHDQRVIVEGTFEGLEPLSEHKAVSGKADNADHAHDSSFNFVNADIHDVVKTIVGDTLGLNYTIAPTVTGNVTIKLSHAIPKESLLPTLDAALRVNGAAIISTDHSVKIVPVADVPRSGAPVTISAQARSNPGFGLQIVPLHYINADEIQRVLAPVAPNGGIMPVEGTHNNIIILSGTEEDRAAMMDVINAFDVDWLSHTSFALFPLKEANARDVTKELWDVLGTSTGPISKIVRLVTLDRLNAILVISAQPRYLKEVKTWITRLDVDQTPSDQKIWVYSVQNGRATSLSDTLNKLIRAKDFHSDAQANNAPGAPATPFSSGKEDIRLPASQLNPNQDFDASQGQNLRIIADDTTNSLIIMGTKAQYSIIEAALKKLDIVPLQVRIEAVIAEVTLTDNLSYGVQYFLKGNTASSVLTNTDALSITPALPGFSVFHTGSKISATLDLLRSVTDVHVISSPQLMVLNNQTALLQVGDEVPIATQSAVSVLTPGSPVVNSIQMQDTGVILKVTPRVNSSGMVLMDIAQEVSDVAPTTSSTIDSPTIQQRKIASSVAVHDGETIALGGLIKDSTTNGRNGIPLLSDIPYLGALFGTSSDDKTRTELLALITPRVVRNEQDVRDVTEEMRQEMRAVVPLNDKIR
jgi:general secretion pathway protein D